MSIDEVRQRRGVFQRELRTRSELRAHAVSGIPDDRHAPDAGLRELDIAIDDDVRTRVRDVRERPKFWAELFEQRAPSLFIAKRFRFREGDIDCEAAAELVADERPSHRPDGQVPARVEILREPVCRAPLRIVEESDHGREAGTVIVMPRGNDLLAYLRVHAIRNHDQIERAVADAVFIHQATRVGIDRDHLASGNDLGSPGIDARKQPMQRAALNTQPVLALDGIAVTKVQERSAGNGLRTDSPDRRAALDRCRQDSELVEFAHARGVQEHAGPTGDGRIVAFKMRDVMTATPQANRGGDSRDAISDDGDVQRAFHRMEAASGATGVMPRRGGKTCGV